LTESEHVTGFEFPRSRPGAIDRDSVVGIQIDHGVYAADPLVFLERDAVQGAEAHYFDGTARAFELRVMRGDPTVVDDNVVAGGPPKRDDRRRKVEVQRFSVAEFEYETSHDPKSRFGLIHGGGGWQAGMRCMGHGARCTGHGARGRLIGGEAGEAG
jgi:hypothetical protein